MEEVRGVVGWEMGDGGLAGGVVGVVERGKKERRRRLKKLWS